MKKLLIGIVAGLMIALSFSFKTIYEQKNTTAEVQKIKGIAFFSDCAPVQSYESLGTLSLGYFAIRSTSYMTTRNALIDKCKKKFSNAEGLIFNTSDDNTFSAEAIVFKK